VEQERQTVLLGRLVAVAAGQQAQVLMGRKTLVETVVMGLPHPFLACLLLMQAVEEALPMPVLVVPVELAEAGQVVEAHLPAPEWLVRLIRVVEVGVAGALLLELAQQAVQASSFSNGPSPYKSQIPLHLPVHG
jgi:hypothetical protein